MWFQIAAGVILLLFYGCYIGKMAAQRKAGIRTDQMGKGKVGFTKWVEILMKIATYLTVAVEAASIVLNTTVFPVCARVTGLLLSAVGLIFFILTVYTMKNSWRAGVSYEDETELVTGGIFQISRNPAFLGFDLVYVGILLMFYNPVLLAASWIAGCMFHFQIVNNEEPFLQDTFGEAYISYKKRVNRYLGRRRDR